MDAKSKLLFENFKKAKFLLELSKQEFYSQIEDIQILNRELTQFLILTVYNYNYFIRDKDSNFEIICRIYSQIYGVVPTIEVNVIRNPLHYPKFYFNQIEQAAKEGDFRRRITYLLRSAKNNSIAGMSIRVAGRIRGIKKQTYNYGYGYFKHSGNPGQILVRNYSAAILKNNGKIGVKIGVLLNYDSLPELVKEGDERI